MFLKMHEPGNYYAYLSHLEDRIELEPYDRSLYYSYKSGWLGELTFYEFLCGVGGLKLWDVTLNVKGQVQFDFIVIYNGRVFHFDVKNFVGNYNYIDGNFVSPGGYVHKDVVPQLDRAHYKLCEFLRGTGYDCNSRVVFVNEDFTVRGFGGDKKVMFHSGLPELTRYFDVQYEPSDTDLKIAALFLDAHCPKEYNRIFYYPFEDMQPGVRCPKCRTIGMHKEKSSQSFSCQCGHQIKTADAMKLAVEEIALLKNGPVCTSDVVRWTGLTRSTAKRHLTRLCMKQGTFKDARYVMK